MLGIDQGTALHPGLPARLVALAGALLLGHGLVAAQAADAAATPTPAAAAVNSAASARFTGQDGAFVRLPASLRHAGPTAAERRPCPDGLPAQTTCLSGTDHLGASYWLAMPPNWNGTLIVHAHGGPDLGPPQAARTEGDLKRWRVFVQAGYAWAASTFRDGGVEVRAAGEDSERARQAFIDEFGYPRRTVLHGQSWGASVAARMAERYTTPDVQPRRGTAGRRPYDAVLLTSGVLGGAPRSYDMRLDLRVVYQALCNNHPRPDEPAYPLWTGLPLPEAGDPRSRGLEPAAHKLTRDELARRVDECTGVLHKPAERSAAQQRKLATLVNVLHIPESALLGHMNWATWQFHDIVWRKLQGRNPFGNEGVTYAGSPGGPAEDETLNRRVARYKADPAALAALAADTDPTGLIHVPVLSLHGIDDPVAFVELENVFRDTMVTAGTADNLLQTYTRDHEHSYLSDAEYLSAMAALLDWVDTGHKPSPADLAGRCKALDARWAPAKDCRFVPDYKPATLTSRVPPRLR